MDTRLRDFATTLLEEIADRLTTVGITVPAHRYVHTGAFVADFTEENCADALIVAFQGIIEGTGNTTTGVIPATPIKCAVPLVGNFVVALLRCVPSLTEDGDAPDPLELQASAEELLIDAMELANAVIGLYLEEGPCALRSIGAVLPFGPEGAVGGNLVNIYMELA